MFSQILLFILLKFFLVRSDESLNHKHFACDDEEKINEVQNIKSNLKRMFTYDDKIFFVLKNRVIFTDLFLLKKEDEDFYGQNYFVTHNFYELVYSEEEQAPVVGYLTDLSGKNATVYEFTSDSSGQINEFANELAFDKVLTGTKKPIDFKNLASLDEDLVDFLIKNKDKIKYFNIVKSKPNPKGGPLVRLFVHFMKQTEKYELRFQIKRNSTIQELHPNSFPDSINSFISYLNEETLNGTIANNLTFIAIDEESFELLYTIYRFYWNSVQDSSFAVKHTVSFNELFSCHTQLKKETQLKGILYDKSKDIFFIFINRFYLRIQTALTLKKFYLTDEMYENNSHELEFETEQIYHDITFSDINKRWIKSIGDQNYFRPNSETYKFDLDKNQTLIIRNTSQDTDIGDCFFSTLQINGKLYCFDDLNYYIMVNRTKRKIDEIKNLFPEKSNWSEFNKLILLFHFDNESIVFMTINELFVLKYNAFKLDESNENYLVYNSSEQIRFPNCIIIRQVCDGPLLTTSTRIETTGSEGKREVVEASSFSTVIYVAGGLFLLLLIIFLIVVCLNKMNKAKDLNKNYSDQAIYTPSNEAGQSQPAPEQLAKSPSIKSDKLKSSASLKPEVRKSSSLGSQSSLRSATSKLKSSLKSGLKSGLKSSLKSTQSLTLAKSNPSADLASVLSNQAASQASMNSIGSLKSVVSSLVTKSSALDSKLVKSGMRSRSERSGKSSKRRFWKKT